MNKILTLISISILIFSCKNDTHTEFSDVITSPSKEDCRYTLNKADVKFEWVAFKTTEKLAVKGSFDDIIAISEQSESDIPQLIMKSKLVINLNTVNSGNEERDGKLKELFFQNFKTIENITGFVEECDGDNEKGKAIINLKMNDNSHQVMMNYKVEENTINLHGGLELLNWKVEKSIDALHEACLDLHTGEDGISKTWSTMEINILVPFEKDCK